MNVGERMRDRRKELKLSADIVAEKLGVSRSTIFRYEKGEIEKIPIEVVSKIAEVLHTTPGWLMGWQTVSQATNIQEVGKLRPIPILGVITCGEPILASENIEGYRMEAEDQLPSGDLFYLRTRGDSMVPTIPDNSFVLIQKDVDVENGEIAAVIVNGDDEATLKRYRRQGNKVILSADNNSYAPIIIDENTPARVLGKAIKVSFDLA